MQQFDQQLLKDSTALPSATVNEPYSLRLLGQDALGNLGQFCMEQGLAGVMLLGGDRITVCDEAVVIVHSAFGKSVIVAVATISPEGEMGAKEPTIVGILVAPEARRGGCGFHAATEVTSEAVKRCQARELTPVRIDALSDRISGLVAKLPQELRSHINLREVPGWSSMIDSQSAQIEQLTQISDRNIVTRLTSISPGTQIPGLKNGLLEAFVNNVMKTPAALSALRSLGTSEIPSKESEREAAEAVAKVAPGAPDIGNGFLVAFVRACNVIDANGLDSWSFFRRLRSLD